MPPNAVEATAIELNAVSKSFVQTGVAGPGLKDVTLRVDRGEFLCIVGPSGCGKTTILNLVAGLMRPDAGSIRFGGATHGAIARHHVGYMLARDSLLPWRTARANVELALEIGQNPHISRHTRREKALALLDLVGLTGFANHYPQQLSQGMRQRVAIARTLAVDPEVFLMDEPFGALDAITRRRLQEEFVRVWSMYKKTVLFVTHDLVEALILGDRIIVVRGRPGKVVSEYRVTLPRADRLASGGFDAHLRSIHERLSADLMEAETI